VFQQVPLRFRPGLYANRSPRSSEQRWVDGNLVRFRDGMPEQVGGWRVAEQRDGPIVGVPREILAWRPNSQIGKYAFIGTHLGAFVTNGSDLDDVTPAGFADGREHTMAGAGYGAGVYGAGPYGTRRTVGAGLILEASVWTADMFGEVLLSCFNYDGKVYSYEAGDAQLVEVPDITARALCVSDERHAFYFGMNGDPSFVGWSDREDYTNVTPDATNRAGGYTVAATSAFQCGRRVRGYVLGWTGTELFGFFPLNNSLVYGRERLGTKCGAAGPQSVAVVTDNQAETAYWMGIDAFHAFDGAVRELECELRDYVFTDINIVQRAKFQARTNARFSEIWFWYCSADSIEIDRAVIFNYAKGVWSKADVARTCWLDGGIFAKPLGLAADGTIYEHEVGDTADGEPMGSFVLSHPLTLGVGQRLIETDAFWPDMQDGSGDCEVTFIGRDYPGGPDLIFGPEPFASTDEKLDLAISARQLAVRIEGTEGYWELGTPLLSMKQGSGR
jgi:hypothetical protein